MGWLVVLYSSTQSLCLKYSLTKTPFAALTSLMRTGTTGLAANSSSLMGSNMATSDNLASSGRLMTGSEDMISSSTSLIEVCSEAAQ